MSEQAVEIACGGHAIPGTLRHAGARAPAVLLCHGLGSHRDEVGGLFARLANELASLGVASLRIDLPGHGAHPLPQRALTLEGAAHEIGCALAWLRARADRVAVAGYSFGARAVLAAKLDAPLALWAPATLTALSDSGAAAAERDGEVELDLGFRRWEFGAAFFRTLGDAPLEAPAGLPLLVVCGRDDTVAGTGASIGLAAAADGDASLVLLAGADHVFNVLGPSPDRSREVVRVTAAWLNDNTRSTAWQTAG